MTSRTRWSTLRAWSAVGRGLIETVACGAKAIPALRALLFEREPSGLFQARSKAVEALAALGAYDVLAEFLNTQREASDPVERIGDEVVTNAAARALGRLREPAVFELLMWLAETKPLPGVIAALGSSGRCRTCSPALQIQCVLSWNIIMTRQSFSLGMRA